MRRPVREINIFSISALDLFASALGAFILITVVLFPYYLKDASFDQVTAELSQELAEQQRANAELQQQLQNRQAEIESLKQRLQATFLVVVVRWQVEPQDVDLWVTNPRGQRFDYRKHNRNREHFANVDAFLTLDSQLGPGSEVWLEPSATPGIYDLKVQLFATNNDRTPNKSSIATPLEVKVYFRDGSIEIPNIVLRQIRQVIDIGQLSVSERGEVTLRSPG